MDILRQHVDQLDQLLHDQGDQRRQDNADKGEETYRDDRGGQGARKLLALQPVGGGVEKIGREHAHDKGKQDRPDLKQKQQQQRDGQQPEQQATVLREHGHFRPSTTQ